MKRETSAGGIVYRLANGEPLFLVIRDSYGKWGFPKGHLERRERADTAALREVMEETGLRAVTVIGSVETIEWKFQLHGSLIHKRCHFFLMESATSVTKPQSAEGITACEWASFDDAAKLISYDNARAVLVHANAMLSDRLAARAS
jgi:8-oxo-dGTP pyrophosphatase MutT (NUDIX family)